MKRMRTVAERPGAEPLECRLASVVRAEMYLAGAAMAIGMLLHLLSRGRGSGGSASVFGLRLLYGDGAAWASLGIMGLLAIPATFILYSVLYFTRRREYGFAAAAVAVLLLMIAGAFSGLD